jgi:outer membrane protein assembly factor BamB
MKKHLFAVGIIFLFLSSVVPMTAGIDTDSEVDVDPLREYYGCYNLMEIPESIRPIIAEDEENQDIPEAENIPYQKNSPTSLGGLMDSAWPMYCHDTRHTGRSPYSTADTSGVEKWNYEIPSTPDGDIVIDENGIIYAGANGLYAFYPNGTLKWKYITHFKVHSAPAIDEDGTIYFGYIYGDEYLIALNPDGTLKWKYKTGGLFSSPAIGDDGTIYFGDGDNWYIKALYPNGTLKWSYKTDYVVYSSPAIGEDGTIYCGSHDTYLYALYPNNGTLKWKYKTGGWIRVSPCISDDGTIYCVSLDNHLHAVYSNNGTRKWRTNVGAGTSPTIGQEGTIYCGYSKLYAVNPTDGSKKWSFDVQGKIRGATPCNSFDGTIYFGNWDGSDIVAVNPDGTEKWRKSIGGDVDTAPAIGDDGTVYISSPKVNEGFLRAFGKSDPNAPSAPIINGPSTGRPYKEYDFTFTSTSSLENDVYYYIKWGDGSIKNWFGPYTSGEEVTVSHKWSKMDTYTIRARAKDTDNLWGPWGTFDVTIPRDKSTDNMLLLRVLERFPLLQKLILFIK